MQAQSIVIAVAALGLILFRQLQPKQIREQRPFTLMVVLAAIGVADISSAVKGHHVPAAEWALLAGSLVFGAVLGYVRGSLVHVWRDSTTGALMRQGNAVTVALWLVSIGSHVGVDVLIAQVPHALHGLGTVSLLLYLGVALAAQRLATVRRGAQLVHGVGRLV